MGTNIAKLAKNYRFSIAGRSQTNTIFKIKHHMHQEIYSTIRYIYVGSHLLCKFKLHSRLLVNIHQRQ